MFFKNIDKWSKQKLRGLSFLFSLLHFVALVLVPIIITAVNYNLFANAEGGFKLTAIGIIVVVILGLYAYVKLKKAIDNLPQIKLSQQRFKFTIQTILALMPIIIILIGINLAKSNFNIAMNVLKWSSVSFGVAILIDGLFLRYITAEVELRSKALELVEIEKRKKLV
jgi:hypothetical protein